MLGISPKLIDPRTRNVVTVTGNMNAIAYNQKLLPADRVPEKWEDFLKPEFKGKKFVTDIRPVAVAALVPAWGLEKTLDFAKKLATQDPFWVRGGSRALIAMGAGEYALFFAANHDNIHRMQAKDPTGSLSYKIVEPVPIRLHEANALLATGEHPYAGLLWLEFLASKEGQKILDEQGPVAASPLTPGSAQEQLTRGKKLSIVDWNHNEKLDDHLKKIVEVMGFPKAN